MVIIFLNRRNIYQIKHIDMLIFNMKTFYATIERSHLIISDKTFITLLSSAFVIPECV